MLEALYPWIHIAGRTLFCMVFILNGIAHFTQRDSMTQYARSRGVPAAGAMVPVAGLVIIAGGLMVLLGWHRFIGAGLLVLFLLPTAFLMHPFWKEEDAEAKQAEMAHFLKDLALAGGALIIAYYAGAVWPMSL